MSPSGLPTHSVNCPHDLACAFDEQLGRWHRVWLTGPAWTFVWERCSDA